MDRPDRSNVPFTNKKPPFLSRKAPIFLTRKNPFFSGQPTYFWRLTPILSLLESLLSSQLQPIPIKRCSIPPLQWLNTAKPSFVSCENPMFHGKNNLFDGKIFMFHGRTSVFPPENSQVFPCFSHGRSPQMSTDAEALDPPQPWCSSTSPGLG